MYDRILVAVDGSSSSMHALQQTFRINRDNILVIAVAPPYAGDLRMVGVKNIESLLRGPCDKALSEASSLAEKEGVFINTACVFGEPHSTIVDVAQAEDCELIVLGKHDPDFLEVALMGSVAGRVIGYSPIDVLVVPEGAVIEWNRILLASDGSEFSKKATVKAMELAKSYGAELEVVSVLDLAPEFYAGSPELAEELAREANKCVIDVETQASAMNVSPHCMVREGKAYKAILDVAKEQKIDLIVVGSHGRTGLKRLLMGSVTERVINHAPCPVLVAKG